MGKIKTKEGKRFIEKYRNYAIYLEGNEYIAVPKPKFTNIYGKTVDEVKLWIDYVKEREALEDLINKGEK
ncbi:MAG: hypothetical protein ACTSSF_00300 [Candidatus Heimdallarchaeaceae archaeon]